MAHIPIDLYQQYADNVRDEIYQGIVPFHSNRDIHNIRLSDFLHKKYKNRKMTNSEINYNISLFNRPSKDNSPDVRRLNLIKKLRRKAELKGYKK